MISTQEMKSLEDNCGISKLILMENAGKAIYNVLKEKFDLKDKKILIVSYHGNNGGDGFVAARYMCNDAEVDVSFVGDDTKLKHARRIENVPENAGAFHKFLVRVLRSGYLSLGEGCIRWAESKEGPSYPIGVA